MKSSIQRILVPLDLSAYTDAATHRACEIARHHVAQVEGLTVLDSPEIRDSLAALEGADWKAMDEIVNRTLDAARDKTADARQHFSEICEHERVCHSEVQVEGVPAQTILQCSLLHDLVVTGLRTFFHFETRDGAGDSLTRILDRTVTPVLAVPRGEQAAFTNVLVTYDGSFGSARALRDFALFAQPYDFEVTIFTSQSSERHADRLIEDAAAFLRSHGIQRLAWQKSNKPAIEALEGEMLREHDLVVLGIHSRKFIKDAFVGSLAKKLIDDGRTALFLSH